MSQALYFSTSFLLAATMAAQTPALRRGVSVEMAVTAHAVAMPDADLEDSLLVAVTRDGTAFLSVNRETLGQLSEKLKAALAGHPGKRVYFKADARTPYSAVASVLDALRTAGVNAPILLTSQPNVTNAQYVPPVGLEVMLPPTPDAAPAVTLPASANELRQHAQRDQPVVLQADGATPFGDVVRAIDVYRGEGAQVFLATAAN